jgi:hypothetical protein
MDEVLVTREGVFVAQSFGKDGVYRLHDVRGPELLTREIDEGGDIAGWTVFEGRLHYIYADAQTIGLYWRPARGGPRRRIAEIAPPFEYGSALAVNPVTRDIVYSRTTTEYDIGVARVRASRGSWEH